MSDFHYKGYNIKFGNQYNWKTIKLIGNQQYKNNGKKKLTPGCRATAVFGPKLIVRPLLARISRFRPRAPGSPPAINVFFFSEKCQN